MKKLLMLLLSVVLAFSAVACNGPGARSDISYFDIVTPDNGFGTNGLRELVRRFEEEFKDKEYAPGKTGVDAELHTVEGTLNITNMREESYHAYISPYSATTSMIAGGDFLNIDEYFHMEIPGENGKTIDDKIPDEYKSGVQGAAAKNGDDMSKSYYYFAPGLSYCGGLSYDKHMFDKEGFYFVAPGHQNDSDAAVHASSIIGAESGGQSFYFADPNNDEYKVAITTPARDSWENWNSNRYLSCGPDGVYGTYDDGMASSLEELIALCERIKDTTVAPFIVSGQYKGNMMPAVDGLINSLLGEENAFAMKTFESESFEVVVGYDENNALWGMSDVAKPITTKVKVTESQGYYTTWSSARYYATAFIKLAVAKGWFTSAINGTVSHEGAENHLFLNDYDDGQYKGAILMESSYWMNETQESTNYPYFNVGRYRDDDGNIITALEREKEIKWLSLPRQISGTVTEGNGTKEIFMYNGSGQNNLFNARYKDDPEALEIIKDWLLFLYRDENLQYLVASTGCLSYLEFDREPSSSNYDSEPFYRDMFTRLENGVEVKVMSTSKTYTANEWQFQKHYWNSCWHGLSSERKLTLYEAFDLQGSYRYTVYKAFQGDRSDSPLVLTKEGWATYYQTDGSGNDMVPTVATYPDGSPVVFNGKQV